MTALLLLSYISAALLLQVALGGAFAFWRGRGRNTASLNVLVADQPRVAPGAWAGLRNFRVVRREFEDVAKTQCSFYLEPVDSVPLPAFQPGQFLTLTLEVVAQANAKASASEIAPITSITSITRCYSLSDAPNANAYRITVKRAVPPAGQPALPPGRASGHLHDGVKVGSIMAVRAPAGHFFIDSDVNVPAVLIAGGIGITPMMSMLNWCLAHQSGRVIHLYYGVRNSAEHAFKAQLEQIASSHANFHLNVAYSRPDPGDLPGRDFQHVGHVDIKLLRLSLAQGRHQFYVCGPSPMMETLVPALTEWGVPVSDIHFEAFGPASLKSTRLEPDQLLSGPAVRLEVQFSRSGRTLTWDGQDGNLLDFAERHSLALDSGCRSGSCGSCETKVLAGSVKYASRPDHDLAPGYCLLCVGLPESPLVLEA